MVMFRDRPHHAIVRWGSKREIVGLTLFADAFPQRRVTRIGFDEIDRLVDQLQPQPQPIQATA